MKPIFETKPDGSITHILIDNSQVIQDRRHSYLLKDMASGTAGIYSQSISGFSVNQILLIGEIGNERSEIIKTHASTTPNGNLITLATNLTYDHPQDTKIYLLNWDKIELYYSSVNAGTTYLQLIDIQVDQIIGIHDDTVRSSGYYVARFYDSINTRFSSYSDHIPRAGYSDDTVFSIKRRALESVNEKIDDVLITDEFLNTSLWEARREIHNAPGKRSWRQRFNVDIGNVSAGVNKVASPSDLDEPSTAKNLFGVRIGTERNLDYRDKKIIDEYYNGVPHTTLIQAYAVADNTLFLDSSRDFKLSGSVTCGTFTIEYAANDISNGTLRISTAGESSAINGIDVWQNAALGLPQYFTVMRLESAGTSYIVFERPVEQTYQGQNIYADYYRTLVAYDSDADTLDEPDYDMYVNYLAWRIKKKKNSGLIGIEDSDYLEWQRRKSVLLSNEREGQSIRFQPDMPGWEAY